ncbi:MAG: hypothetical protein IPP72_01855 [Chitinophagaceae bacterium]|nr:hypothetical protein [Chitinophagaceae bacterium]
MRTLYVAFLIAFIITSCSKKSNNNTIPPGAIIYPDGLLASVGLNAVNVTDTIAFNVSGNLGTISVNSFDWTVITTTGVNFKKPEDTWAIKGAGQFVNIKSLGPSGKYLKYHLANATNSSGVGYLRKTLNATNSLSDSTSFILTSAGGTNFYVEPQMARGYYLSITMKPYPIVEFVTTKQAFFMIAW